EGGDDADYAGIALEHDRVVLWWHGATSESLDAVIDDARQIAPVEVRPAPHTRREIMAAAGQLIDFIRANPNSGYVSVSYPEDGTRVRVGVAPDGNRPRSSPATALAAPAMPPVDVPVELVPGLSIEMTGGSRIADEAPFNGGAKILPSGCTAGFGVY